MMPLDICLSPELIHLYEVKGKTVVVADILRATSCMVTAFAHGVHKIRPFADLEACRQARTFGFETSGERDGKKVDGFDRGNSPFEYMGTEIRDKKIAFTTTNGTQALARCTDAGALLVGAFLNLKAVAEHAKNIGQPVLIVCAGWKGRFNLEDTLYAGALASALTFESGSVDDSVLAAVRLYDEAKGNLTAYIQDSSHVRRLGRLNIHKDIEYCLTADLYPVVPRFDGEDLVL